MQTFKIKAPYTSDSVTQDNGSTRVTIFGD